MRSTLRYLKAVVSPDDAEEFGKYAQQAAEMAALADNDDDKAPWRSLAEEWLKLAQQVDAQHARRPKLH